MRTLLIDADDTLWENNIFFERALTDFISFLEHKELSASEVREVINDVERENIRLHGYGLNSFTKALIAAFERLSVEPITPAIHTTIVGFAQRIAEEPITLLDGVSDTLQALASRNQLYLVTKGDPEEQHRKVSLSGLSQWFQAVEVVREKDTATYRDVVERHGLASREVWMVGNSPRSDINPALAAGVNAVFIPHDNTWVLEHEELASPPPTSKLLRLRSFRELLNHF